MHIDISDAFVPRTGPSVSDATLEHIRSAYAAAKEDQASAGSLYQVSREWLPIYESYLSAWIDALQNGTLADIRETLENFFRNPCSTGLHGLHFEMVEKYMSGQPSSTDLNVYMQSCLGSARLFFLNCRPADPGVLYRPSVGNPYGYRIIDSGNRNIFVYAGAESHYHYARILARLIKPKGSVLELGKR